MKVAIVLDNPKRDLLGVAITAYQLLKLGCEVYVVPMYQQGYDMPLIAPDAVIVNYARPANKPILESYKSLGILVFVMDTEGGILSAEGPDAPENWAKFFKSSALSECIDYYFFWGERVRNAFTKHSGISEDRLIVAGCPRYDICNNQWRLLLNYPKSDYVLINTNFSGLNPAFTSSSKAEEQIFLQGGWDRKYVRKLFDETKMIFTGYLETIEKLAKRNPNTTFLIRPHPFEKSSFYTDRFKQANVVVDGSGNVLNVISNSRCVLHLNCGTSVETNLLGRAPISIEFLNTEFIRKNAPLPSEISIKASDFEDLNELINNEVLRTSRYLAIKERITPWFSEIDGMASLRIATKVTQAIKEHKPQPRRSFLLSIKGGRADVRSWRVAQGLACNLLGSKVAWWARAKLKSTINEKVVPSSTIIDLLNKFSRIEGTKMRFIVKQSRMKTIILTSADVTYSI
jgi:surface carbohydrate biosynthesis protein